MVCCVDVSELAGPQQDLPGAGRGRGGDAAAQEKVLLLRPERGLPGSCPAQPALRTGIGLHTHMHTHTHMHAFLFMI